MVRACSSGKARNLRIRQEAAKLIGRARAPETEYSGSYAGNCAAGYTEGRMGAWISAFAGNFRERGLDEDGILCGLGIMVWFSRKDTEKALQICESRSSAPEN